jgi:hypothetical protein
LLSENVLDREIKAQKNDPGSLGSQAAQIKPMFDHYERIGLCDHPLTLRAILRREPRTLETHFNELGAFQ